MNRWCNKEVTQCERTSIEGGRIIAHFGVLAKGRGLHNNDIYIYDITWIANAAYNKCQKGIGGSASTKIVGMYNIYYCIDLLCYC